jgi:hypothetical protein
VLTSYATGQKLEPYSMQNFISLLAISNMLQDAIIILFLRRTYKLSTDSDEVKFVGYNLKISHCRYVYEC